MRVDRSLTRGTRQTPVLPVGNMEAGLRVAVLLGKTKVDNVDLHSPDQASTKLSDAITYLVASYLVATLSIHSIKLSVLISR